MSRFYGRTSVRAMARMFEASTGKMTAATLVPSDGSTTATYRKCYVWPVQEQSALGGSGAASQSTNGVLWQLGETTVPRADDGLTDSLGRMWLIGSVTTSHNADTNYARHDLTLSRFS